MNLIPTKEQETIIKEASKGGNLLIKAFAGSSKTTTCIMVAEELNKHSLYVAFNKSIAEEAKGKFPDTVNCRTMHSLAYGAIMTPKFRKKLQGWFQRSDIETLNSIIDIPKNDKEEVINITIEVIKLFCQSRSLGIGTFIERCRKENLIDTDFLHPEIILDYWKEVIKESSPIKITHDVYLKLFQLSQPILGFETIYMDEAQDSNEVALDIVLQQKSYGTQLIIVGDSYQAIYAWRGAVDALNSLGKGFKELYLTESFRFTQDIADIARKITSYLGNNRTITGRVDRKDIPDKFTWTKATIVRNNSTLLDTLLDASFYNSKVYVIADLKGLWPKLYHINALLNDETVKYPDKELKQYKTAFQLIAAGENLPEIKKLIGLVYKLRQSGGVHSCIQDIKNIIVTKKEASDFTLVTGHKSKGLEWDEVTLTDDFYDPKSYEGTPIEYLQQEQVGELLYVAITRARYKVNLPLRLQEVL